MNRNQFSENWHQYKNKIRDKWAKITDHDLEQINGKWDSFVEKLQQKYGFAKEQAERELNRWCQECESRGRGKKESIDMEEEEGVLEAQNEGEEETETGRHSWGSAEKHPPKEKKEERWQPEQKKRKIG
ncbi:MAG TPA: CsbD family protein [Chlamydiales bacterium]|nr:CsbD family protein [Chlamydiales bacterium]